MQETIYSKVNLSQIKHFTDRSDIFVKLADVILYSLSTLTDRSVVL